MVLNIIYSKLAYSERRNGDFISHLEVMMILYDL